MGLHGAFGENSYYLTENEGKLMIFICGVKPHTSNFLLLGIVNTFFYSEVVFKWSIVATCKGCKGILDGLNR